MVILRSLLLCHEVPRSLHHEVRPRGPSTAAPRGPPAAVSQGPAAAVPLGPPAANVRLLLRCHEVQLRRVGIVTSRSPVEPYAHLFPTGFGGCVSERY
jgi:hypothetical protein